MRARERNLFFEETSWTAPNSLGVSNPYPDPFVDHATLSQAFKDQGVNILVPVDMTKLTTLLEVITSDVGANWQLDVYSFSRLGEVWLAPASAASVTGTGAKTTYINNPGLVAVLLVGQVSSGSMTVNAIEGSHTVAGGG